MSSKFGKALHDARKKLGFTFRDVEEKTKLSRQTVLRAERGFFVSFDVAIRLFDVLNIKGKASDELLEQYLKEHVKKAKAKAKKPAKGQREARPSA